jgi:hypothetical protein
MDRLYPAHTFVMVSLAARGASWLVEGARERAVAAAKAGRKQKAWWKQTAPRKQKGRALRKPCLVCPDLVAPGYSGDIPTPPRAMTKLFEPTLCEIRRRPLEKTGAGEWRPS